MRWLPVLCYLGIAVWQVGANYDLLFPSDPAKREALHQCMIENPQFNQLDRGAQEVCLKSRLSRPMPPSPSQANFVDLRRADGQGRQSSNDVRRHMQ